MPRFLAREELYLRRGQEEILRLASGSVDQVDAAIGQAEDEAASYLLSRYGERLPATPEATPGVLKDKVAVLAHRRLIRGPQVAQSLESEASEAVSWLRSVARGLASLDLPGAAAAPVDRAGPLFLSTSPALPTALDALTLRNW
jgi:phage gp36-like protein